MRRQVGGGWVIAPLRRCMARDDAGFDCEGAVGALGFVQGAVTRNPQMRIREELRPVAERQPGLLESLVAKMEVGAARVLCASRANVALA